MGGVLQQEENGAWAPLGFFSRKLKPAEVNYATFDRELLAIVEGIKHFQHFLEAKKFTIFTDHKPLVGAIRKITDPSSQRQRRHLSFIAEFTADIQHVSGESNVVA